MFALFRCAEKCGLQSCMLRPADCFTVMCFAWTRGPFLDCFPLSHARMTCILRSRDDLTFRALSWGAAGPAKTATTGLAKTAALSIFAAIVTAKVSDGYMAGVLLSLPSLGP